jgi:hypothetical protein
LIRMCKVYANSTAERSVTKSLIQDACLDVCVSMPDTGDATLSLRKTQRGPGY